MKFFEYNPVVEDILREHMRQNPYFCKWCEVQIVEWKRHIKTKHHKVQSFQIKPTTEDNKKAFCFPCAEYLEPELVEPHSRSKLHLHWCKRKDRSESDFRGNTN